MKGALFILFCVTACLCSASTDKLTPNPCGVSIQDQVLWQPGSGTDVQLIERYGNAVLHLLAVKKFVQLDCIADNARTTRAKFPGGMWKLHNIYVALSTPRPASSDQDWHNHLALLERWTASRPNSITARVALAEAYLAYAWVARGNGLAESVTETGWRLLNQRDEIAHQVLMDASSLPAKCPEWYVAMQSWGLTGGWTVEQATAFLNKAVVFEPDYYYYSRMHAHFLLPQWSGEKGDTERFAKESADRIGGAEGDILYAQIISCLCSDIAHLNGIQWPRVQRGYEQLEKKWGLSIFNDNMLAYVAVKLSDPVIANQMFLRIGDKRDKDTWSDLKYFDACKKWAAEQALAMRADQEAMEAAAAANLTNAEGARYQQEFERKLASMLPECVRSTKDPTKFEILFKVADKGQSAISYSYPGTKVTGCLLVTFARNQYPPPPRANYWVRFDIDPAKFAMPGSK